MAITEQSPLAPSQGSGAVTVPLPAEGGQARSVPRLLLTVEEAARSLHVGRTTAHELVLSGRLESVTVGRLRRVPVDGLVAFVKSLRRRRRSRRMRRT